MAPLVSTSIMGGIGRIDEEADDVGLWHELVQQFQPLRSDQCIELRNASDVLAWLVEVCDEAELDRIETGLEDDRNGLFSRPSLRVLPVCWSRRSRSPSSPKDRPSRPAADRNGSPPNGIRS